MHRPFYLSVILLGLVLTTSLNAQPTQSPPAPAPLLSSPPNSAVVSAVSVGNLSLAQALSLAAARSPLTQQSTQNVAGAAAKLKAAKAIQNPTLSVAHWAGNNTGGLDEDIILTQVIELGGKRAYRIRGAAADLSAAQYDRIGSALDLRLSVRSAYYEALRAQEEYNAASDALSTAQKFAQAAQTQYQAGDVARSNVIRSQVELTRAEQALSAAKNERDNRIATLRSLTGFAPGANVALTDKLEYVLASYSPATLESLALQNRPDIKSAQATRASLEAAVQSARAQSRPDLFIEGRRASIDPAVEGASIRAGVIFTPWDYGSKHANVEAAQAAVNAQDAKIAELQRTAGLEVETDYRDLEQARSAVESFQGGRLARAKELLDMTLTGYNRGASTYLEVLDAQNTYRSEQTEYARALATYNIALATLERAVGGTLQ